MKKNLCLLTLFLSLAALTVQAQPLKTGQAAPQLTVTLDDNSTVDLAALYQKGPVLIYFYPKADTPGCTKQACSLRDAYQKLTEKEIHILGVSTDNARKQKAFKEKFNLPFSLVADTQKELISAFGVPTRGAFASRQAFLIKEGTVVWRDLKASTGKQADDVLAVVKTW